MRTALMTALVLLLIPAGSSHAHVRSSTGYSDVRGEGSTVRYELSLETAALAAAAGDGTPEAYLAVADQPALVRPGDERNHDATV